MLTEIALPNDNEAEFIELAVRLGINKLYFLYDFDAYNEEKIQKKLNLVNNKNLDLEIGFIINKKNMNKALSKSRLLVAKSSDNDRLLIESKKIKLIYGFEEVYKKDLLHQRASGLNHTLCELAKKNNVAIGFSYSLLFNKSAALTSMLMGRMMQNIALCQKYKVNAIIGSFSEKPFEMRTTHDIASLFAMLGMDWKKIKESLMFNL